MNMKLVAEVTASQIRNDLPEIAIGDTVVVGVNIIEGNKKKSSRLSRFSNQNERNRSF